MDGCVVLPDEEDDDDDVPASASTKILSFDESLEDALIGAARVVVIASRCEAEFSRECILKRRLPLGG